MKEAKLLGGLLAPLSPFFDWVAAHPAAAIALIAAVPVALIVVVMAFGRRPQGPAEREAIEAAPPAPLPRPAEGPPAERAAEAGPPETVPSVRLPAPPAPMAPEVPTPPGPTPPGAEAAPIAAPPAPRPEPQPPPPPPPAAPPAPTLPPPARLVDRLARTRAAFVGRLGRLLGGRRVDGEVLEELEALLFGADLGVATAESLLEAARGKASGADAHTLRRVLREAILEKLRRVEPAGSALGTAATPHVVLVLGVNGSGKTTTIGKLAARHRAAGRHVVLGAGDTFRAAAIEQLEIWGTRTGCEVVKGKAGGDPAAVAFDTVKAARARGADVAIIDTAGRLQTKAPLVEELRKIVRVIARECPDAPHETLLVLDANTGQNALSQARVFTEAAGVTGLVLTKVDGTAKGGVLVGLADELGIPVRWVGLGEGVEDLREFHAEEFVDALFASEPGEEA
jgi:fused signal recognition particle receptor